MQRLYNSFRSAKINLARKHTKHHQSVEQRAQKAVFEHKRTHARTHTHTATTTPFKSLLSKSLPSPDDRYLEEGEFDEEKTYLQLALEYKARSIHVQPLQLQKFV